MGQIKYRSKLEQLTAKLLKDNGHKFKYEDGKISYRSRVRGGRCSSCDSTKTTRGRSYLPDFRVGEVIVEAKGRLTSSERTKFLDIVSSNPGIKIYFVFGADNKLNKNKPKRYSDWCNEHGFEYGIKQLPASLLANK